MWRGFQSFSHRVRQFKNINSRNFSTTKTIKRGFKKSQTQTQLLSKELDTHVKILIQEVIFLTGPIDNWSENQIFINQKRTLDLDYIVLSVPSMSTIMEPSSPFHWGMNHIFFFFHFPRISILVNLELLSSYL